jgi:hypothetical protein
MNAALAVVGRKTKRFGAFAAAVVAGGVLSSGLAGGAVVTHASSHPPKAHATGSTDAQDQHGRCVSKVARDHSAVGGPHHNHGGAVSAAAHNCPHG